MTLYVFNPEHDMCMSNGDMNYVPPISALQFAHDCCNVMNIIYGDGCQALAADGYASWHAKNEDTVVDNVVAWGWDMRTKHCLMKQGVAESLLPSDDRIAVIRRLQHRSTILPLQHHAAMANDKDDVRLFLKENHRIVLKAPWSGSGRGIRWIDSQLNSHDEWWIDKVLKQQGSVMMERRCNVKCDFAIEFSTFESHTKVEGLSFFETQSGVYRHNLLLTDDEIQRRTGLNSPMIDRLSGWVHNTVSEYYSGYMGIDLFCTTDGEIVVSEMNLRHTMGLAAHRILERHPEKEGHLWTPANGGPKS